MGACLSRYLIRRLAPSRATRRRLGNIFLLQFLSGLVSWGLGAIGCLFEVIFFVVGVGVVVLDKEARFFTCCLYQRLGLARGWLLERT